MFMVMLVLQNAWFDGEHIDQREPVHAEQAIGRHFRVNSSDKSRDRIKGTQIPFQ